MRKVWESCKTEGVRDETVKVRKLQRQCGRGDDSYLKLLLFRLREGEREGPAKRTGSLCERSVTN